MIEYVCDVYVHIMYIDSCEKVHTNINRWS